MRAPFWGAPLTADEGGYAEVARLWQRGAVLYHNAWVDRPQGLLLVFRAALHLGSSTESLRILAAVVSAALVVAVTLLALRIGGTIEACATALLAGTVGGAPFIESFTLAGELLAALPAVLSLLAFVAYLRRGRIGWLVAAGLLTGCALSIKQSAFDAGLAAIAFLLVTRRRRGIVPSLVLVASALVPLVVCALTAPSVADWWHAVVTYRGQGDSLLTGSAGHRLHLLGQSLPPAGKGLGLLLILGAAGWSRAPLLLRLWLAAALLGVLGGGNFHPHYYVQLVPPLAVLAGFGVRRLVEERSRLLIAATAVVAVATVAVTLPLWFESGTAQAKTIWPHDPHLQHDSALVRYIRANTRPGEPIYALWAAADVYYLADRPPALPYLWIRNVESVPGALDRARAMLASGRPALVALVQPPSAVDGSGRTAAILADRYREVAHVEGVPVLRPRNPG